ncbi:hypothetical protein [Streptomyces sp. NPDC046332]|uniref:hypothetical protein n=1 Tax=Streptomyces sp. NPDC046332 TaxID=3155133 RepID=UPI0034084ED1
MREVTLMPDPQIAALPVEECGERLVDVREAEALLVDNRCHDGTGAFAHLREGVLERLLVARPRLPDGVRLLYVEGYRPPSLQRRYFEEYGAELRAAHPESSAPVLHAAASRYVSPPEIAPHSAGSAVDVTPPGSRSYGCPGPVRARRRRPPRHGHPRRAGRRSSDRGSVVGGVVHDGDVR